MEDFFEGITVPDFDFGESGDFIKSSIHDRAPYEDRVLWNGDAQKQEIFLPVESDENMETAQKLHSLSLDSMDKAIVFLQFPEAKTESESSILIGYPTSNEYAYTLQVFEKSDIYSFGVVLLELLTGRKPMDPEFGEGANIVDWVKERVQTKEGMEEILDQSIRVPRFSVKEEMMLVLRVALLCTSRYPMDRPSMRYVVSMLSEAHPKRKTVPDSQSLQQHRSHSSSQPDSLPRWSKEGSQH